jgi:hypothetical protein
MTETADLVTGHSGHVSLVGGGTVRAAGEAKFVDGQLRWMVNAPGRYHPTGLAPRQVAASAFGAAAFDAPGKHIDRSFR